MAQRGGDSERGRKLRPTSPKVGLRVEERRYVRSYHK